MRAGLGRPGARPGMNTTLLIRRATAKDALRDGVYVDALSMARLHSNPPLMPRQVSHG